jgi:hypothetical protein
MDGKFEVLDEVIRQYRRFNAQGTQLNVRFLPPPDDEIITDSITHFESCVDALFGYVLENIEDADMVGLVIQDENNEENIQRDKPRGFIFRRKDQLFVEVIWNLFEKVAQSNAKLMHWTL